MGSGGSLRGDKGRAADGACLRWREGADGTVGDCFLSNCDRVKKRTAVAGETETGYQLSREEIEGWGVQVYMNMGRGGGGQGGRLILAISDVGSWARWAASRASRAPALMTHFSTDEAGEVAGFVLFISNDIDQLIMNSIRLE